MIKLRITGNVLVEGASNSEEAIAAVKELAGASEIESVKRGGSDAAPVYMIIFKSEDVTLEKGVVEEAMREAEREKEEFSELGDEAAEGAE